MIDTFIGLISRQPDWHAGIGRLAGLGRCIDESALAAAYPSGHGFKSLLAMTNRPALKSHVNVVNLWESRLFVDAHFDDCDHLKYASDGSEILTVKVKESLARC